MRFSDEIYLGVLNKENKYVLIHRVVDSKKVPLDREILKEIDYDFLVSYLRGSSVGKIKSGFVLYNGLRSEFKNVLFPDKEVSNFSEKGLEKLLEDSTLNKRFSSKDVKKLHLVNSSL